MTAKAYKEHPVRETLSRITELRTAPEITSPDVSSNEAASFARDKIFAITKALLTLLEQTPPILVNFPGLSQIHANLQPPLFELTSFLSNKNFGHLENAASQMEQNVLPLFWVFGAKILTNNKNDTSAFIESIRDSAKQGISQLSDERDALNSELGILRAAIDKQNNRLESMIEAASKERAESVAAVSNLQRDFSDKEIERNTSFEKLLSSAREKTAEIATESVKQSSFLIAQISSLHNDASRIVNVVGNIGVTGNYQKISISEAKKANFWRWITVMFFGCGAGIAIATFVKFYDSTIDATNAWTIAIKLLYAIAITAPAWYTARESARHRSNSDRAKQTELELASIGPFIELMPDEKKIEIREKLAQRFFGNEIENHHIEKPVSIEKIKEIVTEAIEAAK